MRLSRIKSAIGNRQLAIHYGSGKKSNFKNQRETGGAHCCTRGS
jgi:hypothetical protein